MTFESDNRSCMWRCSSDDVRGPAGGGPHREKLQEEDAGGSTQTFKLGLRQLTRTNPKSFCGPKRPPAHRAVELRRGYFPPEQTRDLPGHAAPDRSTGHSP